MRNNNHVASTTYIITRLCIMYRSNLLGTYLPPGTREIPGGGAKFFGKCPTPRAKFFGKFPGVGQKMKIFSA